MPCRSPFKIEGQAAGSTTRKSTASREPPID